jgi:hypothetical protein
MDPFGRHVGQTSPSARTAGEVASQGEPQRQCLRAIQRPAVGPSRGVHDGQKLPKTPSARLALAIEEAAKLHPAAEPLIVRAALLPPLSARGPGTRFLLMG